MLLGAMACSVTHKPMSLINTDTIPKFLQFLHRRSTYEPTCHESHKISGVGNFKFLVPCKKEQGHHD